MQVEDGNHYLMTKEEIENKIATYTGGRAAEEVVFGTISTGASNDIEQATKLARAMITRYGIPSLGRTKRAPFPFPPKSGYRSPLPEKCRFAGHPQSPR